MVACWEVKILAALVGGCEVVKVLKGRQLCMIYITFDGCQAWPGDPSLHGWGSDGNTW